MVFKKERMLKRIEAQGMAHMVGEAELAIMDNIDGQEATENCWNRRVNGEPVLWCVGKDGKGYEVNEEDCI